MSEATQAPPATGTFCWHELMTRDVSAAKHFYTELFGWTTEEMPMGEDCVYTMFKAGDTHIGGMMEIKGPQFENVPPNWLDYIAVDDVDASAKKAESLGATITVPPTDIPNVGRFSVFMDPTGAAMAVFKGTENCGG